MDSSRMLMPIVAAMAWLLLGAWGVVNLAQEDWFIGGLMLSCAIIGLWSLAVRRLRDRHARHRGAWPPTE